MQKMNLKSFVFYSFFGFSALLAISCSSTKPKEEQTAETVFNKALEQFNKEDWLEANQNFDIIKLQYPASQYSDDAQYYLAEINYKKEEFILA
ncbi:MAG: outer membrane protein assembly factor BamD, partial [Ignavibacteria bacterium]|nr:outer membrane protein assembly factor BamD [Ignavibacteria bacterium]